MGMGHADRPDYDKLIKLFEKGRSNIPPYLVSRASFETLVDQELFEHDPLFLKFSKALISQVNQPCIKAALAPYK